MAGGIMQLVKTDTGGGSGSQMEYLVGNPEISFFKTVYRRHTNFAMESVRQTFLTKPVLELNSRSSFTCRINRVADLLKDVFLCFTLPSIYSTDQHRFQWIENFAKYAIHSYHVKLDTQTIDQRYGEWMDIWTELTIPNDKKSIYDKMSGNTEDVSNPLVRTKKITIRNNKLYYRYYPVGVADSPSIPQSKYFIPLDFWFTKDPGLALPLIALQYQNLDITIEFRSLYELCQVYDHVEGSYVSIQTYNQKPYHTPVSFYQFLSPTDSSPSPDFVNTNSVDLEAYLECNFIYLDTDERVQLAKTNTDYLIERIYRIEKAGIYKQGTIDLIMQNPVKEIIWLTRRSDALKDNHFSNFTNRVPSDRTLPIMKSARMLWNGMERFEEKDRQYFNLVQPYLHHTRGPREGIYVYSFALKPQQNQPSGAFNASMIDRIQLYVTNEDQEPDKNYDYEYVVYAVYYNIFRVMGGLGVMVFAY